ncbi:MAG TPA: hypothetical protein VJ770_14640 [Stellaceae bacterium]|nr:hypothetical protein [Stellaceae bacterium]
MTLGNRAGWSGRAAMRGGALILGLAAVMTLGSGAPASAQGATAIAMFDGEYTGTATPKDYTHMDVCTFFLTYIMMVRAPQVNIRNFLAGRPFHSYSGTVDPFGRMSASSQFQDRNWDDKHFILVSLTLTGRITGSNFSGRILTESPQGTCRFDVTMTKK